MAIVDCLENQQKSNLYAEVVRQPAARLTYLDGVRALAVLYVCAYHAQLQVWPIIKGIRPVGVADTLFGWLSYGQYGVAIFIVLSGFCLMLPVLRSQYLLRNGVLTFFWKRFMRLMPPYYAAIAISFLLAVTVLQKPLGTHYDSCIPATLSGLWGNLIFWPESTGSNTNHVLWSVGKEAKIYLIFPMLLFLWPRLGKYATFALLIVTSVILPVVAPTTEAWMSHYCGLFGMGMLAADVRLDENSLALKIAKRALWVLLAAVGISSWLIPKEVYFSCVISLQLGVGLGAAILLCIMKNGHYPKLRAALSYRWLATVGLASYSLYLIHAPLLQLFTKYFSHPFVKHVLNPSWKLAPIFEYVLFLVIAVPLMTLISIGFAYVFEGSYFRKGWTALNERSLNL